MLQTIEPEVSDVIIDGECGAMRGRFFSAKGRALAHLVLHAATGVSQHYYRHFARWVAARGVGVLTYDYHDFGDSLHRPLRESRATMADWALRDAAAAERKLAELAPAGPLWALGHSLGGLAIAFRPFDPRFERFVTVGSGQVYHNDHPWSYRPLALLFWFVIGPPLAMAAGYMPGRHIGLGADLPAGVYWQWRRWCTSRDFFQSDIGKSLPQPLYADDGPKIRLCAVTDDVMAPPAAVRRHASSFPESRATLAPLLPESFGLSSLGHIEIFAKQNSAAWAEILDLDKLE